MFSAPIGDTSINLDRINEEARNILIREISHCSALDFVPDETTDLVQGQTKISLAFST